MPKTVSVCLNTQIDELETRFISVIGQILYMYIYIYIYIHSLAPPTSTDLHVLHPIIFAYIYIFIYIYIYIAVLLSIIVMVGAYACFFVRMRLFLLTI